MQNKKEYNLLQNYEWFGEFWLAEDDSNKFSGKLYYYPTGKIRIELVRTEIKNPLEILAQDKIPNTIYGVVQGANGFNCVTLLNCRNNGEAKNSFATTYYITCVHIIIGSHIFPTDYKFSYCNVKYKYLNEFMGFSKTHTTTETLLTLKLNDKLNIDIFPYAYAYYNADFMIKKLNDETDEDFKLRKEKICKFNHYVNKRRLQLNAYLKKNHENGLKGDDYLCKFYKNNNEITIEETLQSIVDFRNIFTLLMNKWLPIETIEVYYNDASASAFVFTTMNRLNQETLNALPEESVASQTTTNTTNIDLLKNIDIHEFIKLIDSPDNKMLKEYLLEQIRVPFNYEQIQANFIIVLALIEKFQFKDKYGDFLKEYANEEILDIFLHILKNEDKKNVDLKTLLGNDLAKNLGVILSDLRAKIVHNKDNKNQVNLKKLNISEENKKLITEITDYSQYWFGEKFNNIIYYLTRILNVLLIKSLFTKLNNIEKDYATSYVFKTGEYVKQYALEDIEYRLLIKYGFLHPLFNKNLPHCNTTLQHEGKIYLDIPKAIKNDNFWF